ncbi:hypothetical protein I6N96_16365 [Enterococcus sp. BWM-S5]|uniref:Lipoprotein n=1 Tax=Enterococcus larvae TaxID=2794352 RepID=A0ABS4CMP8_9ENTE|nr:hypothetical protein [Enterococcus larvae]MBP1047866.1 hypothetical protein [Enterococcus larvae]
MKKIITGIVIAVGLSLLTGCSKTITADDLNKVKLGMTVSEVKAELGSPTEIMDLSMENLDKYVNLDLQENGDEIESLPEFVELMDYLNSEEDVQLYRYTVDDNQTIHIYIYKADDKVIYASLVKESEEES